MPVLMLLLLGGIDFGRVLQAHVTSEAAVRAGASWGAAHFANAVEGGLNPAAGVANCRAGYGPACNIGYQTCTEAAGLPGYSGGAVITGGIDLGGGKHNTYVACMSGTKTGVCTPSLTQSNPWLELFWYRADGTPYTPNGSTIQAKVGDALEVDGTFCFSMLFKAPNLPNQLTWTSRSQYVITP